MLSQDIVNDKDIISIAVNYLFWYTEWTEH